MTRLSGGEIAVRALEDEGVAFVFGIPGAQNLEFYDALDRSEKLRPILVTDEQSAAFMADGVARASGNLACINLVPGPGLTHALSGIAEAFLDTVPLVVLSCGIRSDSGKAFQLHDIDQLAVVRPVSKAQFAVRDGSELYRVIRTASHLARRPPSGPVVVEIPANLYAFRHDPRFADWREPATVEAVADAREMKRLMAMLAESRRPLLYFGLGAQEAGEDLVRLAECLEAPVATTIQGKGIFPENHPLRLWCGFGPMAPHFVNRVVADCDLTLAVGCRFSEVGTGSYGLSPPGPLIHVDVDSLVLGRNYPAALAIEAEAVGLIRSLVEQLPARTPDERLRASIRSGHAALRAQERETEHADRVDPANLLLRAQEIFGAQTVFVTDSGNGLFIAMEHLRLDAPRSFLAPVDYSAMGYAIPAAIGAQLACPKRPVVALPGDGALLMTGLELLTAAYLAVPVVILALRDRELAQIAQFQSVAYGRTTSSRLPDFDLDAICQGLGVAHFWLERDADLSPTLEKARHIRDTGRPVVVEVLVDYSRKTHFTRGVVSTNLGRLSWPERLHFVLRALRRRITG